MQTIPASEIKRRGIAALDGKLDHGPVYVLRNNKTACVILSEAEYARLQQNKPAATATGIWDLLLNPREPVEGRRTAEQVVADLAEERNSWNRD